jgi:hypothetical protein
MNRTQEGTFDDSLKEKLRHFAPLVNVRQGYVCTEANSCVPVFSAIDLVRMSKGCGKLSAKGLFWRILREHQSLVKSDAFPSGIYALKLSPEEEEMIALDAEMACELLMLIPGSTHAHSLRKKAVKSLLEIEDLDHTGSSSPCESLLSAFHPESRRTLEVSRFRYPNFTTLRKLLTMAAILGTQWYSVCLKAGLPSKIILRA